MLKVRPKMTKIPKHTDFPSFCNFVNQAFDTLASLACLEKYERSTREKIVVQEASLKR